MESDFSIAKKSIYYEKLASERGSIVKKVLQ